MAKPGHQTDYEVRLASYKGRFLVAVEPPLNQDLARGAFFDPKANYANYMPAGWYPRFEEHEVQGRKFYSTEQSQWGFEPLDRRARIVRFAAGWLNNALSRSHLSEAGLADLSEKSELAAFVDSLSVSQEPTIT